MSCSFTITFSSTADELVENAKSQVEKNNGTFSGDSGAGTFSIPVLGTQIIGSYTISGQQLTVNISHKPIVISCGQIQKYVENNLGS